MVSPRHYVYISHFLTKWGERMWEFAVALLLLDVSSSSLLLVASFGLCTAAAVVFFGSMVGQYVDTTNRLKAVNTFIIAQNVSVLLSAGSILALLYTDYLTASYHIYWKAALVVACIFFGSVASLACKGSTIALEKNWVPLLAGGDKAVLAGMNAVMRRIDLSCKILAPTAAGFVISYSPKVGAIVVAGWNVLAWAFELSTTAAAYNSAEVLHGSPADAAKKKVVKTGLSAAMCKLCNNFSSGWRAYNRQRVKWAMTGLALLYFTVLSFGILMTAFLKWAGIPASVLGATRGFGAVFGVIATFTFPRMHKRWGLVTTGAIAIVAEFVALLPAVLTAAYSLGPQSFGVQAFSKYLGPYPTTAGSAGAGTVPWLALGFLMGGVVVARWGLWLYDLAVSQLVQETVPERVRGRVSGFQNSTQSLFQMGIYVATLVDHRPDMFGWLILVSLFMVFSALLSYFVFACAGRSIGKSLLDDKDAYHTFSAEEEKAAGHASDDEDEAGATA